MAFLPFTRRWPSPAVRVLVKIHILLLRTGKPVTPDQQHGQYEARNSLKKQTRLSPLEKFQCKGITLNTEKTSAEHFQMVRSGLKERNRGYLIMNNKGVADSIGLSEEVPLR